MKKLLFIAVLFTYAIACHAQQKTGKVAYGPKMIYTISPPGAPFGMGLEVDSNTRWIEYNNTMANRPLMNYVFLEGTKKIRVFAYIPKDSVNNYGCMVFESSGKLLNIDDSLKINGSMQNGAMKIAFKDYNIENKILLIQTFNKKRPGSKMSVVAIYNKPINPAEVTHIALDVSKNGQRGVQVNFQKDGFKFKINDRETVNGIIVVTKPTDITFVYTVYVKNKHTGEIKLVSNNWIYNYFTDLSKPYPYLSIDSHYFSEPGDYQIIIKPETYTGFVLKPLRGKAVIINFTVLPSGKVYQEKFVITIALLIVAVSAGIAGLIIIYLKRKNRKKLLKEQQQKDMAQVQLSAVRSQLNPHFMFNALSGIQNLMNKNEPDQANRYLAKFARITRTILNNNELISLKDEQSLLDDYLQMEQLRFGFTYKIDVDQNLNADNVEIPAMLLQPFVENAVKHGIADLGKNGYIYLNMAGKNKNVVLTVTDNGKGFDAGQQNKGMGIALIKKRIALLNTVYGSSPVLLDIKPAPANTMVIITLTNWL